MESFEAQVLQSSCESLIGDLEANGIGSSPGVACGHLQLSKSPLTIKIQMLYTYPT